MASRNEGPRVGIQPYSRSDHSTQLLADIAALRSYRTSPTQKRDKNPSWDLVNAVFNSVEGFIKKSREQPSIKELQTDMHATEKANEALRRDVTLIKNAIGSITDITSTAPSNGVRSKTYAQAANTHKAPAPPPIEKAQKNREIMVKLNDTNIEGAAHRATREEVVDRVNAAIKNSKESEISQSTIIAAKRHPSGDLTLYTEAEEHTRLLIQHRMKWENALGQRAKVQVPSFGIIVHGVSTEMELSDKQKVEDQMAQLRTAGGKYHIHGMAQERHCRKESLINGG